MTIYKFINHINIYKLKIKHFQRNDLYQCHYEYLILTLNKITPSFHLAWAIYWLYTEYVLLKTNAAHSPESKGKGKH